MRRQSKVKNAKRILTAVLFLFPFMIFYILFMIYPMVRGLWTSLCKVDFSFGQQFVGIDNYRTMLTDSSFWESLGNTMVYVLCATPVMVIFGLLFALIINANLKGNIIFRTIYFMPYVLAVSVVASMWVFMFQPYTGLINTFLHGLGIEKEIYWLTTPNLVWVSIIITTLWWGIGFNMILFLAGLQEIDESLYEAARIDGAKAHKQLWYVTLPGLKNVALLVIILQTIASFKVFAQTFLMTKGGPGTQTRSLVQYIYEKAFVQNDMGVGSAMSYVLLLIMIICALVQFKLLTKDKEVVS